MPSKWSESSEQITVRCPFTLIFRLKNFILEDFQASVIVTNCKNKMEKRVRQRRNRERQGIEANKENTMEVDLPGNSGMERELY